MRSDNVWYNRFVSNNYHALLMISSCIINDLSLGALLITLTL